MKAVVSWSMLFNLAEFYNSSAGVIMPMGVNVAWNNTESVCEAHILEVMKCVCVCDSKSNNAEMYVCTLSPTWLKSSVVRPR